MKLEDIEGLGLKKGEQIRIRTNIPLEGGEFYTIEGAFEELNKNPLSPGIYYMPKDHKKGDGIPGVLAPAVTSVERI